MEKTKSSKYWRMDWAGPRLAAALLRFRVVLAKSVLRTRSRRVARLNSESRRTRSWRGKNRLTNAHVLPAIALRKARRVATAAKSVGMQVRQTIRVNADTPVAGSLQRETPN